MSLYVRVFSNFYTHRKTARLKSVLGNDALWLPPRIWSYAAENQPDGCFEGYTPEELGMLIGYQGDAQAMLKAMLQSGFMDPDPLRIHDWQDHNGFHEAFSRRASKAAKARWEKAEMREQEKTGDDMKRGKQCFTHDSSSPRNENRLVPYEKVLIYKRTLGGFYSRDLYSPWNSEEEHCLVEVMTRPGFEDELELVMKMKVKPERAKYFPRSLTKLLQNWTTTLDQLRTPTYDHNQSNAKPNPRNVGVYQGDDYGEIIQRKMERQSAERQKELSGKSDIP